MQMFAAEIWRVPAGKNWFFPKCFVITHCYIAWMCFSTQLLCKCLLMTFLGLPVVLPLLTKVFVIISKMNLLWDKIHKLIMSWYKPVFG